MKQSHRPQLTLGELIDELAKWPDDANVKFDFCGLKPTTVASYRGYYDQLALGFESDHGTVANRQLQELLRSAIGARFTGWKGGDYYMSVNTPIWAANQGDCDSTAIVGVGAKDYRGGGNRADDGTCVYLMLETERHDD